MITYSTIISVKEVRKLTSVVEHTEENSKRLLENINNMVHTVLVLSTVQYNFMEVKQKFCCSLGDN